MNDPSHGDDRRLSGSADEPASGKPSPRDGAVDNRSPSEAAAEVPPPAGHAAGHPPPAAEPAVHAPSTAEPASATAEDRAVDERTIAVWRWAALIGSVPFAGAAAVFTISMAIAGGPVGDVLWIAYPLLLVALGVNAWWYPAARYRRLRYRLDSLGITITDGILWRTQSSLTHVRIQHTDISQGPLQRRYGVATLKLYTAGSRFTKIELPGLEYGDAVKLRDRLLEAGEGDAV